jgi:hypothetical protein
MSVSVYEMVDSMSGSYSNENESGVQLKVRRRYVIGQCEGFNDVVGQMELYTPRYVVDPIGLYWVRRNLGVNGIGHKYFDCTAEYETLVVASGGGEGGGSPNSPQAGSLAWDTSGHTERIYQALSETRYPSGAANFDEAINVNGSTVEGVDKVIPGMRYSETWIFPAAAAFATESVVAGGVVFDQAYIRDVMDLTGTVNIAKFRAFEPGEALFMGARCQWQGDQPFCSITFDFECRPNVENFYVKGIDQFPKLGWEFVWIRYSDAIAGDTLIRRPIAAYKNKIYEQKSWTPLLITTEQVGRPVQPTVPADPGPPQLPEGWWQAGRFQE